MWMAGGRAIDFVQLMGIGISAQRSRGQSKFLLILV
jgi:hypothetical protein